MKVSLTAFVLLSAPSLGYIPNSNFKQSVLRQRASNGLRYAKETVDTQASSRLVMEDTSTSALEKHLGYPESVIEEKYSTWLKQYDKVASEYRYAIFKKNFLTQEEYNRKAGATFSLNENGDITESESFKK
jgi:hypothetical protein